MNPMKFTDPSGDIEGYVWVCGKCKHACHDEKHATTCCDSRCKICGKPALVGWLGCQECADKVNAKRDRERITRAPKVLLSEYKHDYVIIDGDETGTSVEDWFYADVDERPTWAWAVSDATVPPIDARDVVSYFLEDMHEDAVEDLDLDSLQRALDEWCKHQKVTWYQEDGRIVVIDGQRTQ